MSFFQSGLASNFLRISGTCFMSQQPTKAYSKWAASVFGSLQSAVAAVLLAQCTWHSTTQRSADYFKATTKSSLQSKDLSRLITLKTVQKNGYFNFAIQSMNTFRQKHLFRATKRHILHFKTMIGTKFGLRSFQLVKRLSGREGYKRKAEVFMQVLHRCCRSHNKHITDTEGMKLKILSWEFCLEKRKKSNCWFWSISWRYGILGSIDVSETVANCIECY